MHLCVGRGQKRVLQEFHVPVSPPMCWDPGKLSPVEEQQVLSTSESFLSSTKFP